MTLEPISKLGLALVIAVAGCGDDAPPRSAGQQAEPDDAAVVAIDAAPPPPVVVFARFEIGPGPARESLVSDVVGRLDATLDFAGATDTALVVRLGGAKLPAGDVPAAVAELAATAKLPEPTVWSAFGASEPSHAAAEMLLRAPAVDPERFAASFSLGATGGHAFAGAGGESALVAIAGDSPEFLEKLSKSAELKTALIRAGATGPAVLWIVTRFDAKLTP